MKGFLWQADRVLSSNFYRVFTNFEPSNTASAFPQTFSDGEDLVDWRTHGFPMNEDTSAGMKSVTDNCVGFSHLVVSSQ